MTTGTRIGVPFHAPNYRQSAMSRITLSLLLLAAIASSACLDDSITGMRTLAVSMSTSPSAVATGETVTATVIAMGTGLQGILVDWGDGVVDSLSLSGTVVTAESAFDHDFAAAGSYTVIAVAEDQSGAIADTTTVDVTDPAR